MGEIAGDVSTVVRWIAVVVPLVIAFGAWRRFGSRGSLVAVVGYGVVLGGLSLTRLLSALLFDRSDFTAYRISQILYVGVIVSAIGTILIVIALRRLIAGAEERLDATVELPAITEPVADTTGSERL